MAVRPAITANETTRRFTKPRYHASFSAVTRVVRVDPTHPDPVAIAEAAGVLERGGLVAFPTETVYGLGARGLHAEEVAKIFAAKGRPAGHPVILHVDGDARARALAAGDAEHGASVHFVVPELDAGAVIAQARVPVLPGDTADALAARVLELEHPLLVGVLRLAVEGRIAERGATVELDGHPLFTPLVLGSTLARDPT